MGDINRSTPNANAATAINNTALIVETATTIITGTALCAAISGFLILKPIAVIEIVCMLSMLTGAGPITVLLLVDYAAVVATAFGAFAIGALVGSVVRLIMERDLKNEAAIPLADSNTNQQPTDQPISEPQENIPSDSVDGDSVQTETDIPSDDIGETSLSTEVAGNIADGNASDSAIAMSRSGRVDSSGQSKAHDLSDDQDTAVTQHAESVPIDQPPDLMNGPDLIVKTDSPDSQDTASSIDVQDPPVDADSLPISVRPTKIPVDNTPESTQQWIGRIEAAETMHNSASSSQTVERGILAATLLDTNSSGTIQVTNNTLSNLERALWLPKSDATETNIGRLVISERLLAIILAMIAHGGEPVAAVAKDIPGAVLEAGSLDLANIYFKRVLYAYKNTLEE
ncbi:MAG: hypothetical protein LBI34_03260 [Puniceicoccales bacterium]|jgi:hypothetical protein|nr:hypothetical protein [Puniceicoccales bacterium]